MGQRAASFVAACLLLTVAACSAETTARRDRETFEQSLRRAAHGDPIAAFRVGDAYRRGVGTPRDAAQALRWLEVAGPRGGWETLGDMYNQGDGVPSDPERAASYYRKAAEIGEPLPMYRLGCLHADRRIAAPDPVEGYTWLLIARTIGESSGACRYGHHECAEWAIEDRPGCRARLEAALTPGQRGEAERRAADWLARWSRSR